MVNTGKYIDSREDVFEAGLMIHGAVGSLAMNSLKYSSNDLSQKLYQINFLKMKGMTTVNPKTLKVPSYVWENIRYGILFLSDCEVILNSNSKSGQGKQLAWLTTKILNTI